MLVPFYKLGCTLCYALDLLEINCRNRIELIQRFLLSDYFMKFCLFILVLKALDTFGNCRRPVFSLISSHLPHSISTYAQNNKPVKI